MSGDDNSANDQQQQQFNEQQAELEAKNKQIMIQKLLALKRATPGAVDPTQPVSLLTGQKPKLGSE